MLIELDPASEPLEGRFAGRPFRGWLELASLIEAARADCLGSPRQGKRKA